MALSMEDLLSAFYKNGVFLDLSTGKASKDTPIALATFMAESSLNPTAHNYCCYGIAQINLKAHWSKIPGSTKAEKIQSLYNVDTNLKIAWQIFKESGWSPWAAYTNGSYRKYLSQATKVAGTPSAGLAPPGGLGVPGLDIGGFLAALAAGFGWITDPHNWLRMGTFLGGLVILVLAAASLLSQTNVGAAVLSKGKSFAQGTTKAS